MMMIVITQPNDQDNDDVFFRFSHGSGIGGGVGGT